MVKLFTTISDIFLNHGILPLDTALENAVTYQDREFECFNGNVHQQSPRRQNKKLNCLFYLKLGWVSSSGFCLSGSENTDNSSFLAVPVLETSSQKTLCSKWLWA